MPLLFALRIASERTLNDNERHKGGTRAAADLAAVNPHYTFRLYTQ